ncbi:hypothetical protein [Nocardioides sp. T2.26MG-1]|uniref:hypothetical protein n=1 Tax=Nocardioides sp. T2.26MG-1 TaxID=3041166 RepID=UPI002477C024|nr:hypothetical protein [Nocardioides sp. T2.26MG-1]CAI9415467.1 hypothetical protein HIDPHFAB_02528 [Nocardioides sp. T2.26MG-1]
MRINAAQTVALRLGAVACLIGAVILAVVAITVDTGSPGSDGVSVVDDPTAVELPDPGLFGAQVVVFGSSTDNGVAPSDLGCRLLTDSGHEQSVAKMSELRVLGTDPVTVDGQELRALFAVDSYPDGSVLACSSARAAAPLALSQPSTFGSAGTMVRVAAVLGTVAFFVVGLVGLLLLRPRRAAAPAR